MLSVRILFPDDLGLSGGTLYVAGTLPPRPRLAVVGSRAALRSFRAVVPLIVEAAAVRGFAIVSGGALGIDGDAHRAALQKDVPQVAVLPCGPDRLYPPDHAPLFEAMVRGTGALVFPHAPQTQPSRGMFASRNRLVVELSDAVIVVQAQMRSGTMHTGKLAIARAVPVGAVLGTPGCAALVGKGARALGEVPVTSDSIARDVEPWLDAVLSGDTHVPARSWPPHLAWLREAMSQRGEAGTTVDDLGNPLQAIVALTEAETLGLVVEVNPGRYTALR